MNLNELIKKYEDKINEINTILFWSSPENEIISKSEKKICEEILSDLEQLKERTFVSVDECYDNYCGFIYEKDIKSIVAKEQFKSVEYIVGDK